jgi:hypothetical protein
VQVQVPVQCLASAGGSAGGAGGSAGCSEGASAGVSAGGSAAEQEGCSIEAVTQGLNQAKAGPRSQGKPTLSVVTSTVAVPRNPCYTNVLVVLMVVLLVVLVDPSKIQAPESHQF